MRPFKAFYNNTSIVGTIARSIRNTINPRRASERNPIMAQPNTNPVTSAAPGAEAADKPVVNQKPPRATIREIIGYPKLEVTDDNDSCRISSFVFEHVLACGHLIATALPDEPCAPNCHHVVNNGTMRGVVSCDNNPPSSFKAQQKVSKLPFYCNACVEEQNETLIPVEMDSTKAEAYREVLRKIEAEKRGKADKFRKCYVAIQTSTVPCVPGTGRPVKRYVPRKNTHPFNKVVPRAGEIMFEDVDPNPMDESDISKEPVFAKVNDLGAKVSSLKGGKVRKKNQHEEARDMNQGFVEVSAEQFHGARQRNANTGAIIANTTIGNVNLGHQVGLPVASSRSKRKRNLRMSSLEEGEIDEDHDIPPRSSAPVLRARRASKRARTG